MIVTCLIIIIKSWISNFPIVVMSSHGCVSEVIAPSYSVNCFINIHPERLGFWTHYYCSVNDLGEHFITLTYWGRTKMAAMIQTIFSNVFFWMKMYKFRLRFQWSLYQGSSLQYSSIGPLNGLTPVRRQANIWTNDGYSIDAYMCHKASMS